MGNIISPTPGDAASRRVVIVKPDVSFAMTIGLLGLQPTPNNLPAPLIELHPELRERIRCEHCFNVGSGSSGRRGYPPAGIPFRSSQLADKVMFPIHEPPSINSLLRQVAGDGTSCLRCAKVIYKKTRHLLNEPAKGEPARETALHHAARCQNVRTLLYLVYLVAEEGGNEMVLRVLRMMNIDGETPLHQAIKSNNAAMINILVWMDPGLAEICRGTSPMYMAVTMKFSCLAKMLHDLSSGVIYIGPDGQNALHAAVLNDKGMVSCILNWSADLCKEQDGNGNLPLHLAALTPYHEEYDPILLDAYCCASYIFNKSGALPVHIAASKSNIAMLKLLVTSCPKCVLLPDQEGKTMLHYAVLNKSHKVIAYVRDSLKVFSRILNYQDNSGETALHLAVKVGDLDVVSSLLSIPGVQLDIMNKGNQTALDRAMIKCEAMQDVDWAEDSNLDIRNTLMLVGSKPTASPLLHAQRTCILAPSDPLREKEQVENLKTSSDKLAITSVLIASCTFAASFALPGETASGQTNCGMAILAKEPLFSTLYVANAIAFICSAVATLCAMYAGLPVIQLQYRRTYLKYSYFFTKSSVTAMATTFSVVGSLRLAPDSLKTAFLIWFGNPLFFIIINLPRLRVLVKCTKPLVARQAIRGTLVLLWHALIRVMMELWPALITAIWLFTCYRGAENKWRVCDAKS